MTPTTEDPAKRFFNVARARHQRLLRIHADTVCETTSHLRFKRSGELVGSVPSSGILGWWVEDDSFAGPYRCVELGDKVARFACHQRRLVDNQGTTEFTYDGQVTARIYQDTGAWWIENGG